MTPILLKTFIVLLYPAAIFWLFAVLKKGSDAWYARPLHVLGKLSALLCLVAPFCPNMAATLGAPLALLMVLLPVTPAMVDAYVKIVSAGFLVCAVLVLTGA